MMKRFFNVAVRSMPWAAAVVVSVGLAVSLFQLHQARERYWEMVYFQLDHPHRNEVRTFLTIRAAMRGLDHPIVVLGDSITEMANLPAEIAGQPVINAGIGGTTIADFEVLAPLLLQETRPSLIVVALGTNDGEANVLQDYTALLSHLGRLAPQLLAVAVPPQVNSETKNAQIRKATDRLNIPFVEQNLPTGSTLADRIHLNDFGERRWTGNLVKAIIAFSDK